MTKPLPKPLSAALADASGGYSASAEPRPVVAAPPAGSAHVIRAIVSACSGNLVEWFDFYAYAFTAVYFAGAFFPKGDPTTQLLSAAAVFALGFFMRPLGSWLFGRIADRRGRRASMVVSVLMMC